jgi:hypothetical protein
LEKGTSFLEKGTPFLGFIYRIRRVIIRYDSL